jgi:hypothetical protein
MLAEEAVAAPQQALAQPEVVGLQVETAQKIVLRVLLEHRIQAAGQEVTPLA